MQEQETQTAPIPEAPQIPEADGPPAGGGDIGRLAELEARLAESERVLAEAREALDASEHRRRLERQLAQAEAIDLETAVLLTEAAIAGMERPDVAGAVADLKRRKPFLFRPPAPTGSAMSGRARPVHNGLEDAAAEARQCGDRRALLRYLRMKRGA